MATFIKHSRSLIKTENEDYKILKFQNRHDTTSKVFQIANVLCGILARCLKTFKCF